MALSAGRRLGPYEIVDALGVGGMGEVYRARDTRLNRDVAVKTLLPAVADDPERLARFTREAQVLALLNHPHIAQIYGLEESADGVRGLVMELVEGPTLADRLERGPRLDVKTALRVARQVAEALEAAHERGIIHRDLKPANIKIRDDGMVKVLGSRSGRFTFPITREGVANGMIRVSGRISVEHGHSAAVSYDSEVFGEAGLKSAIRTSLMTNYGHEWSRPAACCRSVRRLMCPPS